MSLPGGATIKQAASVMAVTMAIAAASPPVLAAERPGSPTPQVGDRIRVSTSAAAKSMKGELMEIGPAALRIRLTDRPDPVEVPLASVARLERSLGRRSSAGKGALIGGLVGAGAGLTLVALASRWDCDGSCTGYAVVAAGAFVGAGTIVGAISGALIKTERWEVASLGRIGVSVAPQRRGAALALSVRF